MLGCSTQPLWLWTLDLRARIIVPVFILNLNVKQSICRTQTMMVSKKPNQGAKTIRVLAVKFEQVKLNQEVAAPGFSRTASL